MKKTINVNISGVAFLIDEDAYDMLDSYLQEIEARLNSYEEDSDTVKDIEGRIAEIFKEHERGAHFVVSIDLVKHVITVIGNPSVFGEPVQASKSSQANDVEIRKLTRRRANKVIGGVCGGFADYFKIDVAIFRMIFMILFITSLFTSSLFGFRGNFFNGTPFVFVIIYLIMWICIPIKEIDSVFKTGGSLRDKSKNK